MPDLPPPPAALLPASRRVEPAALWWLADSGGAMLFAACLALLVGGLAGAAPGVPAAVLLAGIAASALWRGWAQGRAASAGQQRAATVLRGLRQRVFAALLPTGIARARLVGEDLRVAVDDVEACEGLVARFAPLRLAAVLSPLLIALAVAPASWVAALILLGTLVPFGLGMALAGLAGKAEAERQFAALSRLSGLFVDRVAALPAILAFGAEARATRQIGAAAHDVATRTLQVLRIAFVSSAVLEFFAALSVALVAVYCGFSLLGLLPFPAPERLTLARALYALALAPEFYLAMRRLAAAYHDRQQGEAAQGAIGAALAQAAPHRLAASAPVWPAVPLLALDGVEVRHGDDGTGQGARIGPVSARWQGPGLHVIAGPTGSGKSSVLHALLGLVPTAAGAFCLNGQALERGALTPLAGWAGQRALLVPGTLRENLLLGAADGDAAHLDALIGAAGLGPLVAGRGLALAIDPRGSGLSGGERRRIALVRALASARPLLVLDEPTADLDPASAAQVADLIAQAARERLVIAATHDPALAARAASVVTLA